MTTYTAGTRQPRTRLAITGGMYQEGKPPRGAPGYMS